MQNMELRQYQTELIDKIRNELRAGKKSICAVLGCGGGKSVIQGMIAQSATRKKNDVLFIVHRKELCRQIENTFRMCHVDFNYCTVGMVQTLCRRVAKLNEPKVYADGVQAGGRRRVVKRDFVSATVFVII